MLSLVPCPLLSLSLRPFHPTSMFVLQVLLKDLGRPIRFVLDRCGTSSKGGGGWGEEDGEAEEFSGADDGRFDSDCEDAEDLLVGSPLQEQQQE